MTFQELNDKLAKVQKALEAIETGSYKDMDASFFSARKQELETIKEDLENQLKVIKEADQGTVATDDEAQAEKLAKKGINVRLTNEAEGVQFTQEETRQIAKKVGAAVAKAVKQAGDELKSIKAARIEPNSFDIDVVFKNGNEDQFSFYIDEDTLHLDDFSYDRELVDVGVKPSGEAIVNVDVLANELVKNFRYLQEELEEGKVHTPQHFDICPGAEQLRNELIKGGKSEEELSDWTKLHDDLFKLEKAVIKAKTASDKHVAAAEKLRSSIINLSRDLNIPADRIGYLQGHVNKIKELVNEYNSGLYYKPSDSDMKPVIDKDGKPLEEETDENAFIAMMGANSVKDKNKPKEKDEKDYSNEGAEKHYIKVPKAEYQPTMQVIDSNAYGDDVADIVDDDGNGNVIIYFKHDENLYDLVMDLGGYDIDVVDHTSDAQHYDDVDEARDINDPALMKFRAAKIAAKKKAAQRADDRMAKAIGDNPYNSRKDSLVAKLKAMRAQIVRDMEQEAEPEGGPIADAYAEKLMKIDAALAKATGKKEPTYSLTKEDLDVGHQDDEPSMLKNTAYESATYAAKLYKKLAQYDQHDGEVDFPNWWQSKLILAKDYLSKAFHYLDSEEKQPMLDKLALQEGTWSLGSAKEIKKVILLLDGLMNLISDRNKSPENLAQVAATLKKNEKTLYNTIGDDLFHDDIDGALREAGDGNIDATMNRLIDAQGRAEKLYKKVAERESSRPYPQFSLREGSVVYMNHSAGKIQKAHGEVVAKMKELAKQYKAGDKSVVSQLKDLTAKKKELEKALEKKVAGIGKNQNLGVDDTQLDELSGDQQSAIHDLQNILDQAAGLGDEARQIFRQHFPTMVSKGDAYGAFELGSSANRYDTTLESLIDEIQEHGDEMEEGKYKSDAQRKAVHAAKAEKNEGDESLSEGATCCGRCGRVHVKGSGCKRPYLKGKDHCRNN